MDDLLTDQVDRGKGLLKKFSWPTLRREPAPRVSFRSAFSDDREDVMNGGYSPVYDPPRNSDFNTRESEMPIAISGPLFPHYFAVQRDTFLTQHDMQDMAASTPKGIGSMAPWQERVNVARPPAVAYGSMVVLQPEDPYVTLRSAANA